MNSFYNTVHYVSPCLVSAHKLRLNVVFLPQLTMHVLKAVERLGNRRHEHANRYRQTHASSICAVRTNVSELVVAHEAVRAKPRS